MSYASSMKSLHSSTATPRHSREFESWVIFAFAIFLLKLLLFALDPMPKLYMGDSGTYLWSAMVNWVPEDRSYFYGYVIRWTSLWTGSLTSLLVLQVSLSALACIILTAITRFLFDLPPRWSYLFGFLCAIDPLQLLYERYIMTEAISLCLFALVLYRSFLYIRDRRWWDLLLVQIVSILLVGFRISFLMAVQINTLLLPLLAFAPEIFKRIRRKGKGGAFYLPTVRACTVHLLLSVALMFLLHTGYKRVTGRLTHREPAYQYATGLTLLAFFGPILQPSDAVDSRVATLIGQGNDYELRDFYLRNSQRFSPGRLIDRLSKIEPNPAIADSVARQTAMNALWRNPLGVLGFGWHTYTDFWSMRTLQQWSEMDFSFTNQPPEELLAKIASNFHLALRKGETKKSLIQRYYVHAWPYYFIILLSPLLSGIVAIFVRFGRACAILLFIQISIAMTMSTIFGGESVRFFQPISFMTLLVIALGVREVIRRCWKDEAAPEMEGIELESKPKFEVDAIMPAQPALIRS